jgi:copper(I)-binding protein
MRLGFKGSSFGAFAHTDSGLGGLPSRGRLPGNQMLVAIDRQGVNNKRLRHVLAPIALAGLVSAAVGCGDDDGSASGASDVNVVEAWAREPAEGANRTAVYGIVSNGTDEEITLLAVQSPIGSSTELHETLVDDAGTMSMQERQDGFVVVAGGTLDLEPGGAHVMIFDVAAADLGESFEVTFVFDGADDVTVPVAVQPVGDADMDMDDGEHPDDTDGD